jgi:hypothetical protein
MIELFSHKPGALDLAEKSELTLIPAQEELLKAIGPGPNTARRG